jgi:simple sugar transport system permease protein
MMLLRLLGRTKLYWGLALLFAFGVVSSPVTSKGHNIFLSPGNLSDVLRQVSITGLVAVGMTLVILIGGIDLSVGSIMAFGSVVTALLLTQPGWSAGALVAVPAAALAAYVAIAGTAGFVAATLRRGRTTPARAATRFLPLLLGAAGAALLALWLAPGAAQKYGVSALLVAVPCVGLAIGAVNGAVIVLGRLQPFIVTLAAMVTLLGLSRIVAGQDSAVIAVYAGTNATADIDGLRQVIWGFVPIPGLFFLGALIIFSAVLRLSVFGRYLYALGGNEEATRLSGIAVVPVKIATYAFSGMLSALASVLFVAQYRQGKPDAGTGLELDAIAAVVIGGTSLMGGRGTLAGTFVGVLIFGMLTNILELHDITTNFQLVLKGLIIVVTVLLQERDLGQLLAPLRRAPAGRDTPAATLPARTAINETEGD